MQYLVVAVSNSIHNAHSSTSVFRTHNKLNYFISLCIKTIDSHRILGYRLLLVAQHAQHFIDTLGSK